jgi:ubiquinone/menaquinone biosynthesis C-methylase UbiE
VTGPSKGAQWQLHGDAAELYERHLVSAVTSIWAEDLVQRVDVGPGERVLDVACGTGIVARTAADRVGRGGRVAGLDINPAMLAVARSLPQGNGPAIEWVQGSALALPFADASHDVVLCQLGMQFVPDRARVLAEMRRVLTASGRIGLSVYGPIERNPGTLALAQALDRHLGTGASQTKRSEHVLAHASLLESLVSAAGFREITVVTGTKPVRFASAAEFVQIQLTATPLASLLADQLERPRVTERLTTDVVAALQQYETDGHLEVPQEAHILIARV